MFLKPANSNASAKSVSLLKDAHDGRTFAEEIKSENSILTVAGFMSGTSLDGVDVAILKTDGCTIFEVGPCLTLPYETAFQQKLQKCLGAHTLTQDIMDMTSILMDYHVRALSMLLHEHPSITLDLLSVHGQTLFHQGRRWNAGRLAYDTASTWQACLPDILAKAFKCPVVFDHRTQDIEQGGEGAPLVPIFHWALAQSLQKTSAFPMAFLNIGGVSNITVLPTHKKDTMWAGDVGPGNALINDYVSKNFSKMYDEGGRFAAQGKMHPLLVEQWMTHDYFHEPFPKSLDRDTFSFVLKDVQPLSPLDGVATLTSFTVKSIMHALPDDLKTLLVCGGGRHNQTLMTSLQSHLSCSVMPCDHVALLLSSGQTVSLNGDGMEAYAFAYLGARTYYGLATSFPKTTGVPFPVRGGRLLEAVDIS